MRIIYEIYAEKYYENISEKLILNVKIRNQSNKYRVRNKNLHAHAVEKILYSNSNCPMIKKKNMATYASLNLMCKNAHFQDLEFAKTKTFE